MATYLEDVKRYVGFDDADAGRLADLHRLIGPDLPRLADHFYEVLVEHDGARAAITEGAAQIARLKCTLVEWLTSGLLGPHDEAYYERRTRIGRRHVAIGLPQQYMFTAMNVMRRDLHGLIEQRLTGPERIATNDAVDKLLDIELAIMLRHYHLEAEERLVRRERGAQADKLRAMQTMTAGLAHEVRNPLNAAKLQLEVLERRMRRAELSPGALEAAAMIHQEIGRLSQLLDEFLAFARPAQLQPTPTDVVALVQHVIELERPPATQRAVTMSLHDGAAVDAEIDAAKIHQVVQNLLRNAIEASPVGGRIDVTVERGEGTVAIRIRDQGPGVPPEVLARIYEPFFSTKEGGTGMGMAIVHSLVALHGGEIQVRCEGGAEFSVLLPRRG